MLELLAAVAIVCNTGSDTAPTIYKTDGFNLQSEYVDKKGKPTRIFTKPLVGFLGGIERLGVITVDETRSTPRVGITIVNHDGKPSIFSECTLVR